MKIFYAVSYHVQMYTLFSKWNTINTCTYYICIPSDQRLADKKKKSEKIISDTEKIITDILTDLNGK